MNKKLNAKTVLVTPAQAKKWLANNHGNRPIIADRVARYAALMRAGKWALNGETIILGPNDELIDGQHRLSAVIESGTPTPMLVARDVPVEVRPTINIGRSRNLPHIIAMMVEGETSVVNVTAWAKLHVRLLGRNASDMTFDEWSAWREASRTGVDWVRDHYYNAARGALRTAPVCGALVFAYRTSPMKVREFAEQLRGGENLKAGMPAHTLLKWFAEQPPVMRRDGLAVARRVLSAVLAHIEGASMKNSQASDRGLTFFAKAHGVDLGRVSHLKADRRVENAAKQSELPI